MILVRKPNRYLLCTVDPGTRETGYLYVNVIGNRLLLPPVECGVKYNSAFAARLLSTRPALVVCEKFEGGRFFGKSSIETVMFIGELKALCRVEGIKFILLPRRYVRKAVTGKGSGKGMDVRVRRALIDYYGEPGTKKEPGKTFKITSHIWAALGLAHTYVKHGTDKPV